MFFNLLGTILAGKVYRASYSRLFDEPATPPQRQHLVVRRHCSTRRLLSAARNACAVDQRFSPVPPRSGAMVAVRHFVWIVGAVLREHPALQLSSQLFGDDWFFESGRGRTDSFDVHHAVHFSDGQLGGPAVVDFGAAAGAPRRHFVVEVAVCLGRFAHSLHDARVVKRLDVANQFAAGVRFAPDFLLRVVRGTVGDCRRPWARKCPTCGRILLRKSPPVLAAR